MNWDWLYALYSVSAMILLLSFIWKVFEKIFVVIVALLFNERSGLFLVNVITLVPYYLIASFSGMVVLGIGEGEPSLLLIIVVGLFVLLNDLVGLVQAQREAERSFDFEMVNVLKTRYLFIALEIVYFVYVIFDPRPAINKVTTWLYDIISWIQNIPFLNWLIAAAAFIYVVYIFIIFITTVIAYIISIFSRSE